MDYKGQIEIGHLLNSDWLTEVTREKTMTYANQLRALVPHESGRLASRITTSVTKHQGVRRDRVVGTVVSSSRDARGYDYAAAAEFGNSRHRGSFAMRRLRG